jgi:hypothetical protein
MIVQAIAVAAVGNINIYMDYIFVCIDAKCICTYEQVLIFFNIYFLYLVVATGNACIMYFYVFVHMM